MTAEMIGAEIIVLDSKAQKNSIGIKGIVVDQSKNCFFVAALDDRTQKTDASAFSAKKKRKIDINSDIEIGSSRQSGNIVVSSVPQDHVKIFRVLKDTSAVGVILPVTITRATAPTTNADSGNDVSQNICILHGNKILANYSPTINSSK